MTRIVHTADWHLGARLIECDRLEEHGRFLDWLLAQLAELRPDLLVVAGDVFDVASPPQEALALYYRFLARLAASVRCPTLILGGNHDSPNTLHAPREVLSALAVRVIATPPDLASDACIELADAVVVAVPFLRERDLRTATTGESADAVAAAIREAVNQHYRERFAHASAIARGRAVIATGHLTALGSRTSTSERSIHIGNLGAVDAGCFAGFAYTALGHIHHPQAVGGVDTVRYAGSPVALGFSEAEMPKEIRVIDVVSGGLSHRAVAVPEFRALRRITATAAAVRATLESLAAPEGTLEPWIELTVSDGRQHPDIERQVREAAAGLRLRVLKLLTPVPAAGEGMRGAGAQAVRSLAELSPEDVFTERLRRDGIDPASPDGRELRLTFDQVLGLVRDEASAPGKGGRT